MKYIECATQAELDAVPAGDVAVVRTGYYTARESSHVEAWGSSHVVARESSHVEASKYVSCVVAYDHRGKVVGGIQIRPEYDTPERWLDYHGVNISRGTVVLYKAVRDDYRSSREFLYQPGTQVECPDWDGDKRECGGGLHLCPHPSLAKGFDSEATRYLACTVKTDDLAVGPMPLQYPQKIKARRITKIVEVDEHMKPLDADASS